MTFKIPATGIVPQALHVFESEACCVLCSKSYNCSLKVFKGNGSAKWDLRWIKLVNFSWFGYDVQVQ